MAKSAHLWYYESILYYIITYIHILNIMCVVQDEITGLPSVVDWYWFWHVIEWIQRSKTLPE